LRQTDTYRFSHWRRNGAGFHAHIARCFIRKKCYQFLNQLAKERGRCVERTEEGDFMCHEGVINYAKFHATSLAQPGG
jgi:hypothetical protein